ncbi:hypothetical protein AVM15_12405, partial [Paraclostridium benzoelyticum]
MYKELYDIFLFNGFVGYDINKNECEYIDEVKFFKPTEDLKKQEYFIVINLKQPKEEDLDKLLNEGFNEIYSEVVNSDYFNNYVIKNTTSIIFLELEDLNSARNNSTLNKKILDIEESKYNFKKNVITYTSKQINDFMEIYRGKDNINEIINDIIYDKNEFIEFKKNPISDSVYNLTSKLQIKIPFLTLKNESKSIKSLKQEIDNELKNLNY